MMAHVPREIATIILALHVSIITKIDGKHTGELMHNLANPVCCEFCSPAAVAGLSVAQVTTGGGAGPGPGVPNLRTIWRAI